MITSAIVQRIPNGWAIGISSEDAALMGCDSIPLPLTDAASFPQVVSFLRSLTAYANDCVVTEKVAP